MAMLTLAQRVEMAMRHAGIADQNEVEARGNLGKGYLSRVLSGERKKIGPDKAQGIAAACGVSLLWVQNGIGGMLDGTPPAPPAHTVVYDAAPPVEIDDADSPLERAFGDAFDPSKHRPVDIDNARKVVRASLQQQHVEGDLVGAARTWLDARPPRQVPLFVV